MIFDVVAAFTLILAFLLTIGIIVGAFMNK